MKIVRHVARDMRQAMRAIRERLGDDAVILSSRRTSEGVELTAAVDFDAQTLEGAAVQPLADPAESPLIRREAALNRRETPLIKDDDEPVRSKLPPSLVALWTCEPTPPVQRFDVATAPSMTGGIEADSPLISKELQSALFDSLVVRSEEPTRAPSKQAKAATSSHTNATFAAHLAQAAAVSHGPHATAPTHPAPTAHTTTAANVPHSVAAAHTAAVAHTATTTHTAPTTHTAATAHAADTAHTAVAAHAADTAHTAVAAQTTHAGHAAHAVAAPSAPAQSPAASARLEAQVAYATQPLDFDLTEPATTPLRATHPAVANDVVGAELKNLRRMLETQLAQLAWNDMTRRAPVHTEMLRELSEIGIAQDLSSQITQQLSQDVDLTYARRFSIAALSQYLLVTGDRWLDSGGRIAFIGSTGVGKTMTLSKLAVRWVLRHGARDLALVAADNIRLGAQDQMRALGQLLGAPVYTPENFETLPTLLSKLQQRFILIDTPGSSLRDTQLSSRLAVLASSASQLQTALVLAASTQAGALEEVVKRFAPANPCCCVLTKVDEAASLGGALSVLIRARVPVSYVSEGQRVPEDLRPARALELVSHAVRLAKATGAAADEDLLRRRFGKVAHAIT